jgi:hypothetical protein
MQKLSGDEKLYCSSIWDLHGIPHPQERDRNDRKTNRSA